MITLGLVQATATQDFEENFNTVQRFVARAKKQGCEALCFPEAFLTGYFPGNPAQALNRDCDLLRRVSALAQQESMDLLLGFQEESCEGIFLSHGLFSKDGRFDVYRKTHLGRKEQSFFQPGNRLDVFQLSCGLKVAVQLCVEVHFPEITQTYTLKGAEVVFAPHAVPHGGEKRQAIWSKFIPARSYDNRIYMACCNQWDATHFGGGCMVTDPKGDVIEACFEDGPQLLCFQVDPEIIKSYHQENADLKHRYYPEQRRPELYGAALSQEI